MLLLTGVRTNEVRFARWAEIDMDAALWTIPAERMKMRKPHLVPLSAQAITCLQQLRQTSRSEHVFTQRNNYTPASGNAILDVIEAAGFKG